MRSLLVLGLCLAGCGGGLSGNDGGAPACTMTVSGAISATSPCEATVAYESDAQVGLVTLAATVTSAAMFNIALARPGMVTSSTWSETDTGAQATIAISNAGAMWEATVGTSGQAAQGVYALDLSVKGSTPVTSGVVYAATGTLTATMPAETSTSATGTATFTASF